MTSLIIGPRTVDQLSQNLAGFDLALPIEPAKRLSRVSRQAGDLPLVHAIAPLAIHRERSHREAGPTSAPLGDS